jgi:hypothetical protein
MLTKLLKTFAFVLICSMAHAQSQINMGFYNGKISIEGELRQVITDFEIENNKIIGEYTYDINKGKLSNCRLDGNKLSCDWIEPKNIRGKLTAIFNSNFSEFIGIWFLSDDTYGGSWTGQTKMR